jgi:type I restriction enzyme, S subunit
MDDWQERGLMNLTSLIKDGSHGSHMDLDVGIPLLSAKDVRDGVLKIPENCRKISNLDYQAIHRSYEVKKYDILLTIVGSIGRCYLVDGTEPQFSFQRSVAVIRPEGIDPKYLFHYFRSEKFQNCLKELTNASAQGGVYLGALAGCQIKFPVCFEEQRKIATILSAIDKAIEQTEAIIAKQQRIKTGLMQDLLTRGIDEHGNIRSEETHAFKESPLGRVPIEWRPEQIVNVASLQRGHDITESELRDGPFPVMSSSGIIGYHAERTSIAPNVVVGRKGTIGKVHYLTNDFWAHDTSLYVTDFHGNKEKYIFYLFEYLDLARHGTKSGSPSLNRNDIHPLWIGVPSRPEQEAIAGILSIRDDLSTELGHVLQKLRRQKSALMHDLLTGKVRVTPLLEAGA